ncbi:MAG: molybdopterin-dependent oxidoreductase [Candidatus Cloacimonadota bacterium]|nr:molybdopterin-dependent oxidoreductase [Candidatus Cloacimonadota bacterium]
MKIKIIGIILFASTMLFSIELVDSDRIINLERSKLDSYEKIEISTHRNKDGEEKNDIWIGVKLADVLQEYNITNYDKLCFISSDNYLVRVSKEDVLDNNSILALIRNGKTFDDEHIRLVIPRIRDMFWIQDISTIKTESISDIPFPHTIYFAKPILLNTQIRDELPPFVKVSGYTFSEIMSQAFPFLKDEMLIVGKDGVKHSLDYDKYLKNAVLIKTGDSFDLKSPDMPAGMWIKNLAYVQIFDVAVIFQHHFTSLSEVNDLLKWNNLPEEVILHFEKKTNKQNSNEKFNIKNWSKAEWLEW